jgi:hypothetical protein
MKNQTESKEEIPKEESEPVKVKVSKQSPVSEKKEDKTLDKVKDKTKDNVRTNHKDSLIHAKSLEPVEIQILKRETVLEFIEKNAGKWGGYSTLLALIKRHKAVSTSVLDVIIDIHREFKNYH